MIATLRIYFPLIFGLFNAFSWKGIYASSFLHKDGSEQTNKETTDDDPKASRDEKQVDVSSDNDNAATLIAEHGDIQRLIHPEGNNVTGVDDERDSGYVEDEELDFCFVDLSDSEDDLDLVLEDSDCYVRFNVESQTETEDSYRRTGRRHLDSFVVIESENGEIMISHEKHIQSGSSMYPERQADRLSLKQPIHTNMMNSVDQERKRKVFCDFESNSFDSYLNSGYLDSSLQSSEFQKDFDSHNPLHVSEQVVCWEDGINTRNVDTELVNVNRTVENITENFNANLQEEKLKVSSEKRKGNINFAEKMSDFVENEHEPLLGVMLCALFLNLCVIAAVFTQSGFELVKYAESTNKQKKKANKKHKMLQTSRREKRKKKQILRDIINWQISLRRNTTVMYDYHSITSNCGRIYPSTSPGPTALQQIANETGIDEVGEGVVQNSRAEVNPQNQTRMNGFSELNRATDPRNGNLPGRYEGRNLEASRFYSNPVMGAERPTDCNPLSTSMPAQLHSDNIQTSNGAIIKTLPVIAEGENTQSLPKDNTSVQATEEKVSHVAALERRNTDTSPFSLAPELDGTSLTSTETLSDLFSSLSLSSVEEDETFRYEWIRLKTFSEWPLTSLFSTVLARDGWVSLGEGDRARCYSCHIVRDGWRSGDNPVHYHDQNCRFHGASSDNIPIVRETPDPVTQRTMMRDLERVQQTTDFRAPGNAETTATNIAPQRSQASEAGSSTINLISQENIQNRPQVSGTRNSTINLMSQDNVQNRPQEMRGIVMATNTTASSEISGRPPLNNQVAANRNDTTSPDQLAYTTAGAPPSPSSKEAQLEALKRDPMGINFERPKYPSYAILAVRISSYTDWPAAMTQTPRDMSLAGFFYAGYGDYTRCFFCGGGLRNWEAGDDPWVEHARWFSKCAFVRQNRGQQFIDLVLKRAAEVEEQRQLEETGETQTNIQTGDPATTQTKEDKIMKSAAVRSIKDMGYDDETIKAAISTIKSRLPRGKHKVSAQEILEVIFEMSDSRRATETSNNQSSGLVDQSETVNERASSNPNQSDTATERINQSDTTTERINQSTNEEAAFREASNTGDCNLEEAATNSLPNPTFDELTSLRHENTSLKDQILCKICMEKNVSIAFLPCGHLACCVDCAPAMRKCPICREFVRGTVKTFLV
ncbi:uncharacterized protein LOC125677307 [Ostrea edulis]|uniref:uncharacterized protein LOC125677307 n=1 Tax=Ostrea edulis TaxID=37623 RepID=UPI0024AEBDB3|nr:uncharacterized protein LOC125677307 [Ostrea edulis]XP_056015257.1 uncharacterized protein LOC125677307 [Ostrea edulis]XP_056015258.1 uncharacterized protein LOC125677307 [Ostrea edulis]XP_056015259.1 uncharacterized protein LOC125677307 [Ostrea edulis]XP_056015260.1 uncharacterized protein LOC125677307 [Ostrea edulis]XP_056015261.1 uncharacterized protein LOC125677307 [Ostrea edulis]